MRDRSLAAREPLDSQDLLDATREGRDAVLRYPMARGVAESYDRLAELLRSRPPATEGAPS